MLRNKIELPPCPFAGKRRPGSFSFHLFSTSPETMAFRCFRRMSPPPPHDIPSPQNKQGPTGGRHADADDHTLSREVYSCNGGNLVLTDSSVISKSCLTFDTPLPPTRLRRVSTAQQAPRKISRQLRRQLEETPLDACSSPATSKIH